MILNIISSSTIEHVLQGVEDKVFGNIYRRNKCEVGWQVIIYFMTNNFLIYTGNHTCQYGKICLRNHYLLNYQTVILKVDLLEILGFGNDGSLIYTYQFLPKNCF